MSNIIVGNKKRKGMLKRKESEQMQLELVTYDLLVRPDHLLRKIDAVIDFSFIYDLCAPLYCADNGRPAIDPEILYHMLFVGYLYGIRSEVRLCEEIQDNNGVSVVLWIGADGEGAGSCDDQRESKEAVSQQRYR